MELYKAVLKPENIFEVVLRICSSLARLNTAFNKVNRKSRDREREKERERERGGG